MARVRLNALAKELNLGIGHIVDYLNSQGASLRVNPLDWVDTKYIPILIKRFGYSQSRESAMMLTDNSYIPVSRYQNNPIEKRILLLDGFRDESSRDVLENYKSRIRERRLGSLGTDDPLTIISSISRLLSRMYEGIENEIDFFDCCYFYSCEWLSKSGIPSSLARENHIYSVVDAIKPDIVIVLSSTISSFLDLESGIDYYGHLTAKRIKTYQSTEADYIFIKEPIWLEERDLKLFLQGQSVESYGHDDIFSIPKDIFTRRDKSSNEFIRANIHDDIKNDLRQFEDFIRFVSSISGLRYERSDIETLLRVLTGYPFEEENGKELRWHGAYVKNLFYVVQGFYKRNKNAYSTIERALEKNEHTPDWVYDPDKSKYFTRDKIDPYIVKALNELYPSHYLLNK